MKKPENCPWKVLTATVGRTFLGGYILVEETIRNGTG